MQRMQELHDWNSPRQKVRTVDLLNPQNMWIDGLYLIGYRNLYKLDGHEGRFQNYQGVGVKSMLCQKKQQKNRKFWNVCSPAVKNRTVSH